MGLMRLHAEPGVESVCISAAAPQPLDQLPAAFDAWEVNSVALREASQRHSRVAGPPSETQRASSNVSQGRYQFVLLSDHRRPVAEAGVADDSCETGGDATGMQRLGGAYQGLGGDAADIYACSADRAVADECHVRA